MKTNKIVCIGWCSFGKEYDKNYMAVATSEKEDMELMFSRKIDVETEFYEIVTSVKRNHPGERIYFLLNNPDSYLLYRKHIQRLCDEDKEDVLMGAIFDDCSPDNQFYQEIKNIYPFHFNLTTREYQAALAACLAVRYVSGGKYRLCKNKNTLPLQTNQVAILNFKYHI